MDFNIYKPSTYEIVLYEKIYIEKYNIWVGIINKRIPLIVSTAKNTLYNKCVIIRMDGLDYSGWRIGSDSTGCYKTDYYLLENEKLIEIHYFVSNGRNLSVDLSYIDAYSEVDYCNMAQIYEFILKFCFESGTVLSSGERSMQAEKEKSLI